MTDQNRDSPVPPPPLFVSPRARRIAVLGTLGLALIAVGTLVLVDRSIGAALDPATVRGVVERFGVFAPIAFIGLQILQVVFAPIPGQVLALAGGYAFGPVLGTVYSLIGATIGSAIAFSLSRHFGRPAVERLIHPETLAAFDAFLADHGRLAVFLVFLLPGLPDDTLCFAGGLTSLPLRELVALSFIGRIPGYALLALAGGRLATHRPVEALAILGVVAVIAMVAYRYRDWIGTSMAS